MNKKIFIIAILFMIFTIYGIGKTYGLFESNITSPSEATLASWNIAVNETVLGEENTFIIDRINWQDNNYTLPGKASPGRTGYFDIAINPTGSQVAIRYDLTMDISFIEGSSISITSITSTTGDTIVRTDSNTYSGVVELSDVENGNVSTIRINIEWVNNEENNELDSSIGLDPLATISIPITLNLKQYLGDELTEYVEPVEEIE